MHRLAHLLPIGITLLTAPLEANADESATQATATNGHEESGARAPSRPSAPKMYTTYFYTAAEAVVHGYENQTQVRIVSVKQGATIWQGKVNKGQTRLIPTGKGVFAFLADKKASILVGTPSSCTVVGYWLRDRDGGYVSDAFFGQLPASTSNQDDRVVFWAWEDLSLQVTDFTADKLLHKATLKAGQFWEIDHAGLGALGSHVLHVTADKKALAVQVYQDEGYYVPARNGRAAGKDFVTYVGAVTDGKNDLNLISYQVTSQVEVTDIKSGKSIWKGPIGPGTMKTLTLSKRHVRIRSDREIAVAVVPFEHHLGGYAEHHFGVGVEGTGIETEFLLPTPGELWIFSYYNGNQVRVDDARTGKQLWQGNLGAGHVQGLTPGHGFYRVKSTMGVSVMGGAQACGAEFSPATGLFRVDEAVLSVAQQIVQERHQQAAARGRKLTPAEAAAPLSKSENKRVQQHIRSSLGQSMSDEEVQQRFESVMQE